MSTRCRAMLSRTLVVLAALVPILLPLALTPAQAADTTPPYILLTLSPDGLAGEDQVFTAEARDDQAISEVHLYYRRTGDKAYDRINMQSLGNSNLYSATLSSSLDDTRAIEYYAQVRDTTGHRSVDGFAFEPYVRQLQTPAAQAQPSSIASTPAATQERSGVQENRRLWQIGGGLLLLAAIASLSSSSGDDDSPSASNGNSVPLSIRLSDPAL